MNVKEIIDLKLDVSNQRITTVPPDPYGFIFQFFRGNTLQWNVSFVDDEGVEVDLSSVAKVSLELKDIRNKLIPDPNDPLALYTETDTVGQPTVLESPASQNGIYSGAYWCTISLYGDEDQLFTAVSGRVFVRETGQGNNLPPPVVQDLRDQAVQAADRAEAEADRAQEIVNEINVDLTTKADRDGGNIEEPSQWRENIGLGNVDNTSDADKPVSTAQQEALDLKADISSLGDAASLDVGTTAGTVAAGDDSRFTLASTALQPGDNISELVNDAGYITIGDIPSPPVTSVQGRTGAVVLEPGDKADLELVASDVGLGNVDNTSDMNKPVSTAQQEALDLKADISSLGDAASLDVGTTAGTVAAGDDSRFLTAGEKAAAAGTSGSPSDTNRYVTDADTSVAATSGSLVRRNANGAIELLDDVSGMPALVQLNGVAVGLTQSGSGSYGLTQSGTGSVGLAQSGTGSVPFQFSGPDAANIARRGRVALGVEYYSITDDTDDRVISLADNRQIIVIDNSAARTVTINQNATTALPVGFSFSVVRKGTGSVEIIEGGSTTILAPSGLTLNSQGSIAQFIKIATDEWVASGDLAP